MALSTWDVEEMMAQRGVQTDLRNGSGVVRQVRPVFAARRGFANE
jgi:hypothetical protein